MVVMLIAKKLVLGVRQHLCIYVIAAMVFGSVRVTITRMSDEELGFQICQECGCL